MVGSQRGHGGRFGVKSLFLIVLDLCRFRGGPQYFPASGFLASCLFFLDLAISGLAASLHQEVAMAIAEAFVSSVLLGSFIILLLWMTKHQDRVMSSLCAVYGSDAMVTLVAIPLLIMGMNGSATQDSPLILLIVIWSLAIFARILKIALGVGWALSIALAVVFNLLSMEILALVFSP